MQFVSNGPDIPDALLQAHEEGRVVFFCGAGISYPAGLPGFKGLVEEIYRLCGTTQSDIEREAFARDQFDTTLNLLERRLPGQRRAVRHALMKALKPKLRRRGATDTHTALMRLARNREGALRLVTTNFDRLFHTACKRTDPPFQAHAAPLLPIPKNSRWDGLVFLHGLLPETRDDTALNQPVVTSGDFGLAYLTERWAARFVSELFRNYVVCFVGYSISDPVLRYMMDALAGDRMLGEVTPQAWAMGDCEEGQETQTANQWKAKGVTPILYNRPAGGSDHSALHQTLRAWADTYRYGVQGKEAIIVKHALARPQDSTQQDDFVGRMLWALSDKSGLPAKRFAEFDPVPSLDWLLDAFGEKRFEQADLSRFGVLPGDNADNALRFSLIRRPAPDHHAPSMLLASNGPANSSWDAVMYNLASWLVRHLDDPKLVIWIAQQGGQLHSTFSALMENRLNAISLWERTGKADWLDAIRAQAPNAIPGPLMRTLWRFLLTGRVKSSRLVPPLHTWLRRLQRDGLTSTLRLALRDLLAPKVTLRERTPWLGEIADADEPTSLRHLVDWQLVLATDNVYSSLLNPAPRHFIAVLPDLLEDFQQLLRDALDLLRELGEADDRSDHSHWALPSISPYWQTQRIRDWVSLIELLRDAWLAVRQNDSDRATRIAQAWFDLPYATFKRLALFAASQDGCIPPEQWVDWLLADGAWWLWSKETGREVFRLLISQGRHLAGNTQARLEPAILAGPPRNMYPDGLEPHVWQRRIANAVWHHLAKLNASGLALGTSAAARLTELSAANPSWSLPENESDEFSIWIGGTGDPGYQEGQNVDIAPRKRRDLTLWLVKPLPERDSYHEDTWPDMCRNHFPQSLTALCHLARRNVWPARRWGMALYVWAEPSLVLRAWRYAAPLVKKMPDAEFQEIIDAVALWMKAASNQLSRHQDILLGLCRRVLTLPLEASTGMTRNGEPIDKPVTEARNHPIGNVTQALINLCFQQKPNDNDHLPADIAPFFTQICDSQVPLFRHGRVILASHLIALFRVDRPWTEKYLLPLFAWDMSAEAKAVWQGFLLSPRPYPPLLIALKPQFLETAKHYTELGDHREKFATLLTYAALDQTEGYLIDDFRRAIAALPQQGLNECAHTLAQALHGAADQREEYWNNRVHPFWQNVWPQNGELASRQLTEVLTQLVIAAGGAFPAALDAVHYWLQPLPDRGHIVTQLHGSGLCSRFPNEALQFLYKVIPPHGWLPQEFPQCLNQIITTAPDLARDDRYQKLWNYYRQQ